MTATTSSTKSISFGELRKNNFMDEFGGGLKNLKIVAKNLENWTTTKGQSYNDLNELYNEMIGVYRRYIYHVIRMVGGVNETLMQKGQDSIPFKNLDQQAQIQALNFLNTHSLTVYYMALIYQVFDTSCFLHHH